MRLKLLHLLPLLDDAHQKILDNAKGSHMEKAIKLATIELSNETDTFKEVKQAILEEKN